MMDNILKITVDSSHSDYSVIFCTFEMQEKPKVVDDDVNTKIGQMECSLTDRE